MSPLVVYLAMFGAVLIASLARAQESPRLRVTVNDSWQYAEGPIADAETRGFNDTAWMRVDVQHMWFANEEQQRNFEAVVAEAAGVPVWITTTASARGRRPPEATRRARLAAGALR
ncbi:MAG: hypothetical protein HKN04_15100 [Rhodothermaceae bacterium]|nr:hypothetical protein [Rhodothermaceae bacterium]